MEKTQDIHAGHASTEADALDTVVNSTYGDDEPEGYCDELLECLNEEIETLESIYADEGVVVSHPEIVTVTRHTLFPNKKSTVDNELAIAMQAKIMEAAEKQHIKAIALR